MWEPGAGWKLLIQSADIWHLSLCAWVERHSKCAKRGWNTPGFTGSKFMLCIGQMKGCLSGFHCRCPSGIHHRYWDFHICLKRARRRWNRGYPQVTLTFWPALWVFRAALWATMRGFKLCRDTCVLRSCFGFVFFLNFHISVCVSVSCNLGITQDITEYVVFRWGSIGSFCSYFTLFKHHTAVLKITLEHPAYDPHKKPLNTRAVSHSAIPPTSGVPAPASLANWAIHFRHTATTTTFRETSINNVLNSFHCICCLRYADLTKAKNSNQLSLHRGSGPVRWKNGETFPEITESLLLTVSWWCVLFFFVFKTWAK